MPGPAAGHVADLRVRWHGRRRCGRIGLIVAPGWHPDPWHQAPLRWWDGRQWTAYTSAYAPPVPPADDRLWPWARAAMVAYLAASALALLAGAANAHDLHHIFDVIRTNSENGVRTTHVHLPSDFYLLNLAELPQLGGAVVFLIWQERAASTAARLGYPARRSPGLGIGSWFIPVVSLWFPYQALSDCLPPDHPARARALPAWLCFLAGSLVTAGAELAGFVGSTAAVVALGAVGVGLLATAATLGWQLMAAIHDDHRHRQGPF